MPMCSQPRDLRARAPDPLSAGPASGHRAAAAGTEMVPGTAPTSAVPSIDLRPDLGTSPAAKRRDNAVQPASPVPAVVCCIDDVYLLPMLVLMSSIAAHPGNQGIPLHVLHSGLTATGRGLLHRHAARAGISLRLHAVTRPVAGPVSGWVSAAVYLRLSISDTLPELTRVLYLDADTLVLRDLRPLLATPLRGLAIAAVRDPQNPVVGRGIALRAHARLGVPELRDYFNSGVMLLDLPQCARSGLFPRARRFLARHRDLVTLWDQDALNVAADDAWLRLDRTWNTFGISALAAQPGYRHDDAEPYSPLATLLADEPRASILHFAGPAKPWHDGYPSGHLRSTYRQFMHRCLEVVPHERQ
jgi:lipopolysaccharide biosynthesis glycosyltransferase